MFVGHYAPAFLAAALSPRAPRLGTLFVAAQFLDYGFFALSLAGLEGSRFVPGATAMMPFVLDIPYTHSLLGAAALALVAGLAMVAWHGTLRPAAIVAAVVLSHWLIDALVHAPDLTLAGAPPAWGLALWNRPWIAVPLEVALTAGAFAVYLLRTRPVGPRGRREAIVLAVALILLQLANWTPALQRPLGPALALAILVVFTLLAYCASWMDRCRALRRAEPAPPPAAAVPPPEPIAQG